MRLISAGLLNWRELTDGHYVQNLSRVFHETNLVKIFLKIK